MLGYFVLRLLGLGLGPMGSPLKLVFAYRPTNFLSTLCQTARGVSICTIEPEVGALENIEFCPNTLEELTSLSKTSTQLCSWSSWVI